MWRFNPFTHKEPSGLEGRTIDVGNVKIHVRNSIAEGGFSCVYLVHDAMHYSKQYALKHMICNDADSLDLVMKEISVMELLKRHPNVVALVSYTILDMGRIKEALLLMELCERSLATILEDRVADYFEEKQVLLIFRDICNAVLTMHCQSPPIAHRDLKVENVLLGADGAWKLCDFGSTSTNHKCFTRPEEIGIEEDNIRKYTTPAYRAPEMWDLFRREFISEKVDIWALGCILYRICYLKSAFDGESRLQILNGNYRIPESPKYSDPIAGLIKVMLEASPDARPDITQVWLRVNEQLGIPTPALHDRGVAKKAPLMPEKSPLPSLSERALNISPQSKKEMQPSHGGGSGVGSIGEFWSTPHAQNSQIGSNSLKKSHVGPTNNFEIQFFANDPKRDSQKSRAPHPKSKPIFQNQAFNTLVTKFDPSKLSSANNHNNGDHIRSRKEELGAEVVRLKEQMKQAKLEKAEITSKYEKLCDICRCQRQEIQVLKRPTPSPSKSQITAGSMQSSAQEKEKIVGGLWELEQGMFANSSASPGPHPKLWEAFTEEPKAQPSPITVNKFGDSFWTTGNTMSGFGHDGFTSAAVEASNYRSLGDPAAKKVETNQPVGWAGF